MAGKKRSQVAATEAPLLDRIRKLRGNAGAPLALERLEAELPGSPRYDLVAALKELEKAGEGALRVARKGEKASFVWAQARPRPAQAGAAAVSVEPVPLRGGAAHRTAASSASAPLSDTEPRPGKTGILEHSFHVRPHVMATFRLPADVTAQEIERLCQLLQAIPFR